MEATPQIGRSFLRAGFTAGELIMPGHSDETIDLILVRVNRLEVLIYFCLIGSIPDILSVTGGI